jgi:hypothetical protein
VEPSSRPHEIACETTRHGATHGAAVCIAGNAARTFVEEHRCAREKPRRGATVPRTDRFVQGGDP